MTVSRSGVCAILKESHPARDTSLDSQCESLVPEECLNASSVAIAAIRATQHPNFQGYFKRWADTAPTQAVNPLKEYPLANSNSKKTVGTDFFHEKFKKDWEIKLKERDNKLKKARQARENEQFKKEKNAQRNLRLHKMEEKRLKEREKLLLEIRKKNDERERERRAAVNLLRHDTAVKRMQAFEQKKRGIRK